MGTGKNSIDWTEPEKRSEPAYMEATTLLNASSDADALATGRIMDCEIALFGVPFDLGVTNRPGARFGPRALRAIERVGPYNHIHRLNPFERFRILDIGDTPFRSRYDIERGHADIEDFVWAVSAADCRPVAVGGDHSITLPILKALGRSQPLGLIHIDAHCDTEGPIDGLKFHHGGPFREAVLEGVLDPARTIQIGIRGAAEPAWTFSYECGMTVVHAEALRRRGIADVVDQARRIVGDGPVYVSFDIDALDPSVAPGTGTPEPGGLSAGDAIDLLTGLAGLDIVGGDVVEVAPMYDANDCTALVAAQIMFEIVCLVAMAPLQRAALSRQTQG